MYRHTAESIKESSRKMFISLEEKNKFNDYENTMRRKDDSYNKEEVDSKLNQIKNTIYETIEGVHNNINNTLDGYLKDVEIKGNTVQDANNLADIRSVGDKVEGQELYEIPVLSVGKNIWNTSIKIFNNNKYICTDNYSKKSSMKLPKNSSWVLTFEKKPNDSILYVWKGDVQSRTIPLGTTGLSKGFTLVDDEDGISFYAGNFGKSPYDAVTTDFKIQLEEGTVATPYEPYQEDKLTILSPVQLEKVEGVADRLYYDEDENVWCIEKNINTVVLNGSEKWGLDNSNSTENAQFAYTTISDAKRSAGVISNRLPKANWLGADINKSAGLIFVQDPIGLLRLVPYTGFKTLDNAKSWLQTNPTTIYYQLVTPQKIVLPHSQQIKLRTFANKTNISFLTEIEGTMKAQVPKSLGATVNTHTTQIDNLNKELDRVKKLEESTVSTVETESDFTVVEATSNGYFEDMKLEGKTLVNLLGVKSASSELNTVGLNLYKNLEANKDYTIIFKTTSVCNSSVRACFLFTRVDGTSHYLTAVNNWEPSVKTGVYLYKLNFDKEIKDVSMWWSGIDGAVVYDNIMLLEGDHTQNPPSGYIEGLASVGEDVDEIVVSSVKGDGNLLMPLHTGVTLGAYNKKDITFDSDYSMSYTANTWGQGISVDVFGVVKGETYVVLCDTNTLGCIRGSGALSTTGDISMYSNKAEILATSNGIGSITFKNAKETGNISFTNLRVVKKGYKEDFSVLIQDKKRLLYYNEETQTWEKPILREWDSVEKHSDGKYYYHQRSGEVVLNGSENIGGIANPTESNYLRFYLLNTHPIGLKVSETISNLFRSGNTGGTTAEYVGVDGNGRLVISILKSKLSTQDITGFKNWLQANNVTVVYQLAEEKVFECTNIDLITYANETNYMVNGGVIVPKTTLKVHNNISNVVSLLQKKANIIESDIHKNTDDINLLYNHLGIGNNGVHGVIVDMANNKVDRKSLLINKDEKLNFDTIFPWSGMKRCTVNDEGNVTSWYGDSNFVEDGSIGQVMVHIPKFYYKVTPLSLSNNTNGEGLQAEKISYEISGVKRDGFKLHPAFIRDFKEIDSLYVGAYEASIFDTSANKYLLADERVVDEANDKLCSIINAKPASTLNINQFRQVAENRGENWGQIDIQTYSALQLLMLVEYASFDMQSNVGLGHVNNTSDTANVLKTGQTSKFGNKTGTNDKTSGKASVSYRGIENLWGNIWSFVDGLTIECNGLNKPYIKDCNFVTDTKDNGYKELSFSLCKSNGYASRLGYDPEVDYLFLPTEAKGASNKGTYDYYYQNNNNNGYTISLFGGKINDSMNAGPFYCHVNTTSRAAAWEVGSRLCLSHCK